MGKTRRTLWENSDLACPIVGTCLTVAELRKICRKCGAELPKETTDYEAHGFLVQQATAPGPTAKYLQRYLDKKYRQELRTVLALDDERALRAFWRERLASGDIPGAFWALLSHPGVSDAFRRELHGEVHMLAHRIGAANRAELARHNRCQEQNAALTVTLEHVRTASRRAITVWKSRCRHALDELATERRQRHAAEREGISLRQVVESSAVAAVSRERDRLKQALRGVTERLEACETAAGRQAVARERLQTECEAARRELAERDAEVAALEASLVAALGEADAARQAHAEHHCPVLAETSAPLPHDAGGTILCGPGRGCPLSPQGQAAALARLDGKRILYVGGRCSLVARYKRLAASFGCELVHHDGGREQACRRLWELLGAADAVVCPVDCVSHEACALVKQACRGGHKPLVLARSSGLSSLARSLAALGGSMQTVARREANA